jgi:hydrogenase maturation protease
VDLGDDGAGVVLAEKLIAKISNSNSETPAVEVLVGGTVAERLAFQLYEAAFDQVIFMDAVECGAEPGAVVLLGAGEMTSRFPQVSTHKLSLGLLARMIEGNGKTKVWLLGVQPASLRPGRELSEPVQRTVTALAGWLGTSL